MKKIAPISTSVRYLHCRELAQISLSEIFYQTEKSKLPTN